MMYQKNIFGLLVFCVLFLSLSTGLQAEWMLPVTIQKGTNLIHIARDYCTSRDAWKDIARINNLKPPYTVHANQEILIPFSVLLTEELAAQVGYISGKVEKQKVDGTRVPLTSGDKVGVGQTLVTGKDGYAQLVFPGNKYTRVGPDSKLTISSFFKLVDGVTKVDLYLEKGGIVHDVKEKLKDGDTFNTQTAVSLTGIRGTKYRMKMEEAEVSIVETLEGSVNLRNNKQHQVVVRKGEGVRVAKGEALRAPKPLPDPPQVPKLEGVYRALPIKITIPESTHANMVRLRITKDREGQNPVVQHEVPPGDVMWVPSINDGTFFAFFTAIDKEGFESKPTDPIELKVRTIPSPPVITSPKSHKTGWEEKVTIQWLKIDGAQDYHIEFAKDKDFAKIIEQKQLPQREYETPPLSGGTYFFRVKSIAPDGFESNYSQPIQFTKVDQPTMGAIQDHGEKGGLHFQWPMIVENCTYDFEVAIDKNFTILYMSKYGLVENSYSVKNQFPYDRYYVRVRATLENGEKSQWTPAQKLEIKYDSKGYEYVLSGLFFLIALF